MPLNDSRRFKIVQEEFRDIYHDFVEMVKLIIYVLSIYFAIAGALITFSAKDAPQAWLITQLLTLVMFFLLLNIEKNVVANGILLGYNEERANRFLKERVLLWQWASGYYTHKGPRSRYDEIGIPLIFAAVFFIVYVMCIWSYPVLQGYHRWLYIFESLLIFIIVTLFLMQDRAKAIASVMAAIKDHEESVLTTGRNTQGNNIHPDNLDQHELANQRVHIDSPQSGE